MQVRISLRHVRKQEGDSRTVGSHQLVLENRNNAPGVGADDSGVRSRNYQGAASRRVPDGGVSTKSESPPRPGDTEARGAALSKGTLTGLTPRGGNRSGSSCDLTLGVRDGRRQRGPGVGTAGHGGRVLRGPLRPGPARGGRRLQGGAQGQHQRGHSSPSVGGQTSDFANTYSALLRPSPLSFTKRICSRSYADK